jgi:bifunctional non-homologous end joining protein LigD
MGLEEYRAKRNFSKTREPPGRASRSKRTTKQRSPIFVVQEHDASRLHYDFRLEVDGALASWAVPKEPSMDPAQKRLAVHVEDHPLDYANFEGTIPEGHYGAGTVSIWDRGTYENLLETKPVPQGMREAIEQGHLEIVLHGNKLKGRFALIRMRGKGRGKENWLLIKMKDEQARASRNGRAGRGARPARQAPSANKLTAPRSASRSSRKEVHFTHLDKVMYPDLGITKGDVIEFYRRIAPRLLPYLRDRPVTLERFPHGIDGGKAPHFWQKNTPSHYPSWLPRIELRTAESKPVKYALVNDRPALLYLANQDALTFHVGFSRVQSLEHPDFVLFDLDPGQASFGTAVAVAKRLRTILNDRGTEAFVKTSGKTGLHVMVAWGDEGGYSEARAWALEIAEELVRGLPEQSTTERMKAKRGKRVYVDVMQNALGHHAVPAYVLRAVPGAPVSTPLDWKELTPDLDPKAFNLKTILRRLARQKRDPMAALIRASANMLRTGSSER